MRTIKTTVYEYNELPSEEAKEKARNWWIELEMQDAGWMHEHFQSMDAAIKAMHKGKLIPDVIKLSKDIKLTGYCADSLLADLIKSIGRIPSDGEIENHYRMEWEKELRGRIESREYIEEQILANEYEFTANGEFY